LDLSYGDDLTALSLVFPWDRDDGETVYDLFVEFWKPKGVLAEHEKKHRVKYAKWAERGLLNTPPGPRLKLKPVAKRLNDIDQDFDVQSLAYDKYRIKDLEGDLADESVELTMIVQLWRCGRVEWSVSRSGNRQERFSPDRDEVDRCESLRRVDCRNDRLVACSDHV
jgi:phage terminase large subunit-like protein